MASKKEQVSNFTIEGLTDREIELAHRRIRDEEFLAFLERKRKESGMELEEFYAKECKEKTYNQMFMGVYKKYE